MSKDDIEKQFAKRITDIANGKFTDDRVIRDEIQPGLMTFINDQGRTFVVTYKFGTTRPYLTIGRFPDMTLEDARRKAAEIIALVDSGIDPWPTNKH